eukprot:3176811-Lingulodinium_polyedra.AAC.1
MARVVWSVRPGFAATSMARRRLHQRRQRRGVGGINVVNDTHGAKGNEDIDDSDVPLRLMASMCPGT